MAIFRRCLHPWLIGDVVARKCHGDVKNECLHLDYAFY